MNPDSPKPEFDWATARAKLAQINEGAAQLNAMFSLAATPGGGAITPVPPVAAPLTAFAARPGTPLPDTDSIPNRLTATLAEWLDFLDDHSLNMIAKGPDGTGNIIGYCIARGGYPSNVALAMKDHAATYPPALTHCQTLRAIQQGVPPDKDIGARWDDASRTWLDKTGRPYVARTDWTSVVATG